jgi:N-acetylglucosaminyldiphosphoundecaprenol N-acetyl-beta-D-mannosaminyltransferase
MKDSVNICHFTVSTLGLLDHAKLIAAWAEERQPKWVLTLNLQMISEGLLDKDYDALLHQANFVVADGMPIVWSARFKGHKKISERTTGVDLVKLLLTHYNHLRFAIIGGEHPSLALKTLGYPYPERVFIYNGKITASETFAQGIAASLRSYDPHIVFIALGAPKETYFISLLHPHLPSAAIIGVGGTFEMLASIKPRAPLWMQQVGLEWFYRLLLEPRRLWRRYLLHYPIGVFRLLRDLTTHG